MQNNTLQNQTNPEYQNPAEKNLLRNKLIDEMKKVFSPDTRRINHALSVLDFSEKIQAIESGDALVVTAAAIFHDIGIHEAERKYNSSAGKYQEIEGPPIAEKILNENALPIDAIKHICKIIANHHSAKDIDTKEFRIIWDADNIVNLREELTETSRKQIQHIIDERFKTKTGYKIATEILIR
jgi:HD superfamily phosphodiesterase